MSWPAAKHQLPASDEPSVTETIDPIERWEELFGCPAPLNRVIVDPAIAWREQVEAEGDVPPHILRDLRILAHQLAEARRHSGGGITSAIAQNAPPSGAPRSKSAKSISCVTHALPAANTASRTAPPTTLLPASSQLAIGARIVKHHGGETHVVEVTGEGMLYRGQTYTSLSAVAKVITGTHWNGLLFFGLRRRKTYARKACA